MASLFEQLMEGRKKVAVVGLGYVGLPLALGLAGKIPVLGYDTNPEKIAAYQQGEDPTGLHPPADFADLNIDFTTDAKALAEAAFFIITVPTPIHEDKRPKLDFVEAATWAVGKEMPRGAIVVYVSTVYPGITESLCIPLLEKVSGLREGEGFHVGYSPARTMSSQPQIKSEKSQVIVAATGPEAAAQISEVFALVGTSGVYTVRDIKTAEAIKLAENAQRDVNVAFMNELSMYFDLIGVRTNDVLAGMKTKANALNFEPGLFGGHSIGIDPYYFIYQSEKLGFSPDILVTARETNDSMGAYVARKIIMKMIKGEYNINRETIHVLGAAYKENTPDIRNAKSKEMIKALSAYGVTCKLSDPYANPEDIRARYGLEPEKITEIRDASCLVFTVAHDAYRELRDEDLRWMLRKDAQHPGIIIDLRRIFDEDHIRSLGYDYWSL